MKQLYDYRMLVSINGEPYRDTSTWSHIKHIEPEEAVTIESHKMSFDEAYKKVDSIMNAEKGKTFLLKRRYIKFSFSDDFNPVYLYEKTATTISIKEIYIPYTGTIKSVASHLSSEDFIEYLKNRGIATCPLIKD